MKTIVYIGTSLDHYIARHNGEIDWLMPYSTPDVFESYHQLINRVDCLLMGKNTFEKVLTFSPWPYTKKVFVLSNSLKHLPPELEQQAEVISATPGQALKLLCEKGFNTVYLDGGKLIQSFLKEDLVDELIHSTMPVLIGEGIPLFGSLDADLQFQHIKTDTFPNGLVMSFYKRARTGLQ